ncbi:MAG: precorrin-2 C(20)-methyltransferase [Calothrix sp. MO_192.B10]|nr:precorrin-2 C(20)-methyltransferase [Calothrix sp. MO_192.B10]
MKTGILYGISVGTGDPELITVKGLRLLQQSPVIAFPAGVNGKLGMAQQIIAPWLQPEQEQLPLTFPYVRDMSVLTQAWIAAAEAVWQYLQNGKDVAFACEGDISFYSTFTYLAQTLQALHPELKVELVPGVTSPMAAASVLGCPLTIRQEKLAILPAIYTIAELATVLDWADVVVLMKVSSVYPKVWKLLQQRGLLPNSSIVVRATLPDMITYKNLSDRQNLELPYFSILIVQITNRNN